MNLVFGGWWSGELFGEFGEYELVVVVDLVWLIV
jgi:hypothetical protein